MPPILTPATATGFWHLLLTHTRNYFVFLLLLPILCIVFASYAAEGGYRQQDTGFRAQGSGHTRHRGVDRGKMARHLHAMYEINYYALSHRPGQNLQHEALLGLRLRLRSSHSERLDSGIGIACPAHSNFQGTIRAFSALSLPSAF